MRLACFIALLPAVLSGAQPADSHVGWHVDSPRNGARIHSSYVALSGTGPTGECARVRSGGIEIARVCAARLDASTSGFDGVIRLQPGQASIEILPETRVPAPFKIEITVDPPAVKPAAETHWERMRPGDVVLSRSPNSEQTDLYNAVYTHSAIYFGAGSEGVPLIAEAVTPTDAEGLGEVRTVPIEQSFVYRRGEHVAILRPAVALNPAEQRSLREYLGKIVNHGLKYWSTREDYSTLYTAWMLWDPRADRPRDPQRFARVLRELESRKVATDRFNCAGLVWTAYRTATAGRVDLAVPNRAEIGGRLAGALSPRFLARVQPFYVAPDSLYRSGKLVEVTE